MTDRERKELYGKECDRANSHLEAPLLGEVRTPLCVSCTHIDMKYDTWDAPVCDIYGENPLYLDCHHFDCPQYTQKAGVKDCDLPEHMRKGK